MSCPYINKNYNNISTGFTNCWISYCYNDNENDKITLLSVRVISFASKELTIFDAIDIISKTFNIKICNINKDNIFINVSAPKFQVSGIIFDKSINYDDKCCCSGNP